MIDIIKLPKMFRDKCAGIRLPSFRIPVPALRLDVSASAGQIGNEDTDREIKELYQKDLARFTRASRNDLACFH